MYVRHRPATESVLAVFTEAVTCVSVFVSEARTVLLVFAKAIACVFLCFQHIILQPTGLPTHISRWAGRWAGPVP